MRRGDAVVAAGWLACAGVAGCGASPEPPAAAPSSSTASAEAPEFPDDPRPLPRFHSARLGVSLPLPDGQAWRIDDHTRAELVATHALTRSRVTVAVLRADTLVGRGQCETMAHERGLVPSAQLRIVDDEAGLTQQTFDTRTLVAIDPGAGPELPVVGHVMAFGGFLRKCFVFDYATEVDRASGEAALSARLAYARARILGGMTLEAFDSVQRQAPGPGLDEAPDPSGVRRQPNR